MREARAGNSHKLSPRVYAIMAVTTLGTFGTLVAGYRLLAQSPFA